MRWMANNEQLWQEAKKKCRLNNEDIALAKQLGLNPRSLIKNIPSKSEPWKAPVKIWIHEIAEKRGRKSAQKKKRREKAAAMNTASPKESTVVNQNIAVPSEPAED